MQRSLSRTMSYELATIVHRHFEEMSQYFPIQLKSSDPPADILICLERLLEICLLPPAELDHDVLEEAYANQSKVEDFLRLMNQQVDAAFDQLEIGRILKQSKTMCQSAVRQLPPLPLSRVWDVLAPVKPDHLEVLEGGMFEARWWNPIPWMDVYLLRHTEGVIIHDEQQNTKTLPEGLCVRFSLVPSRSSLIEDS